MFLFVFMATAATPLLPPGEDPQLWARALAMGDFSAGKAGTRVELLDHGETWEIRVTDPNGGVRTATVPPPQNNLEREDIILLASSLMKPLTPRDDWGRPTPPRPPEVPRPPDVPRPPTLSYQRLEPEVFAMIPPPNRVTIPLSMGRITTPHPTWLRWEDRPWLELEQKVNFHSGFEPGLGLGLAMGWHYKNLFPSINTWYEPSTALLIRPLTRMGEWGGSLGLRWVHGRFEGGGWLGLSARHFTYSAQDIGTFLVPQLGASLALRFPIFPAILVQPFLGSALDLVPGTIAVATVPTAKIVPIELTIGVSIHLPMHTSPDRSPPERTP